MQNYTNTGNEKQNINFLTLILKTTKQNKLCNKGHNARQFKEPWETSLYGKKIINYFW